MADIAPSVLTETLTLGESTATWQDPLQRSVTETLTVGSSTTQRLALLLQSVSETLRVSDWVATTSTGALKAGIYDVTLGGGSAAASKWLVQLVRASGAPQQLLRFYTPAGGSFVTQVRLKVNAGDVLLLSGPNPGIVNLIERWV